MSADGVTLRERASFTLTLLLFKNGKCGWLTQTQECMNEFEFIRHRAMIHGEPFRVIWNGQVPYCVTALHLIVPIRTLVVRL